MAPAYGSDAGDIVWLQSIRRPHTSRPGIGRRWCNPASYKGRAGLVVYCPTTTRIKGCPFAVALAETPARLALAE